VTEFPADSAGERAAGDEPAAEFEFTGFDAEIATAMKDLGERVGPDEFDARAILRRTARRKTSGVLASAAAALVVVAGATAFAAQHGSAVAVAVAVQPSSSASSGAAVEDTDPLVLPGYFRAEPSGGSSLGSTVYQVNARLTGLGGTPTLRALDVQTEYSSGGTEYTVDVGMMGTDSLDALNAAERDGDTVVGTVAGHPAYYNRFLRSVVFWSGSQGYAQVYRLVGPLGNAALADPDTTMLLGAAKAFDATPSDLPLPLRITGLDSAQVTFATFSQAPGSSSWTMGIQLAIDGRTYEIDANPGPAVTPSATATETTGGEFPAMETVDGVGISVSTDTGTSGSPSAPTVSQVLAHVTSLGADPSGWTTDVIVE
jgi:hypothetical protein